MPRKPKLGDVRRWLKDLSMVHRYSVEVFYRRKWNHHAWATSEEDAKLKERALHRIFKAIIREARETRDG